MFIRCLERVVEQDVFFQPAPLPNFQPIPSVFSRHCSMGNNQAFFSQRFTDVRQRVTILTDERVKLTNQVITGARPMKLNAWEPALEKEIRRRDEGQPKFASMFWPFLARPSLRTPTYTAQHMFESTHCYRYSYMYMLGRTWVYSTTQQSAAYIRNTGYG